ncbi:Nitroreductase-like protein [Trichoderma compactum]
MINVSIGQLNVLATLINDRHTVRQFLPEPVPREVLEKALSIAQRTASNNNLQPWRAVILTGEKLETLNKVMVRAWDKGWPDIPETPADYMHHKENLGAELYGNLLGIGRDDYEKRKHDLGREFSVLWSPSSCYCLYGQQALKFDLISAGFWMQNLTLALRAQGVEACYQAGVAVYAKILQRELDLSDGVNFLSAITMGYEGVSYVGNTLRMTRDQWARNVQIR